MRSQGMKAKFFKAFVKQQQTVQKLEATITGLKSTIAKQEATIAQQQKETKVLAAQLKEQAALIQKVTDKVELNKPTPQVVLNNQ